jgi:hypothetical protein
MRPLALTRLYASARAVRLMNAATRAKTSCVRFLPRVASGTGPGASPSTDLSSAPAKDTMAGLTQRLIDQFLHGCVFLEHEDGHWDAGRHAATLTGGGRRRQTQMSLSAIPR